MSNAFKILESELEKMRSIHDGLQASIGEIHKKIESIEHKPIDASSAVQNLQNYLASQQTEDVLTDMVEAFSHDRPITNWTNRLTGRCFDNAGGAPGSVSSNFIQTDLGPLMATFFEKIVIDHMAPLIEAACKNGVTAEDRDKQITELREQVRKLEEQEEAGISEAEINDFWSFTRREDVNPEIVLSLVK